MKRIIFAALLAATSLIAKAQTTTIHIHGKNSFGDEVSYDCNASQCQSQGAFDRELEYFQKQVATTEGNLPRTAASWRSKIALAKQCMSICNAKARCRQSVVGGECISAYFID